MEFWQGLTLSQNDRTGQTRPISLSVVWQYIYLGFCPCLGPLKELVGLIESLLVPKKIGIRGEAAEVSEASGGDTLVIESTGDRGRLGGEYMTKSILCDRVFLHDIQNCEREGRCQERWTDVRECSMRVR